MCIKTTKFHPTKFSWYSLNPMLFRTPSGASTLLCTRGGAGGRYRSFREFSHLEGRSHVQDGSAGGRDPIPVGTITLSHHSPYKYVM